MLATGAWTIELDAEEAGGKAKLEMAVKPAEMLDVEEGALEVEEELDDDDEVVWEVEEEAERV